MVIRLNTVFKIKKNKKHILRLQSFKVSVIDYYDPPVLS